MKQLPSAHCVTTITISLRACHMLHTSFLQDDCIDNACRDHFRTDDVQAAIDEVDIDGETWLYTHDKEMYDQDWTEARKCDFDDTVVREIILIRKNK